jgi:hypothetical protein
MLSTAKAVLAVLLVKLEMLGFAIAAIMLAAAGGFEVPVAPLQTVPFIGLSPSGVTRHVAWSHMGRAFGRQLEGVVVVDLVVEVWRRPIHGPHARAVQASAAQVVNPQGCPAT